jgi:hypothetical protein
MSPLRGFLGCPKPDLDPPDTKSVSGRLTLIAGGTVFGIEAQLPGRQPLAQDTSAEASNKPVLWTVRRIVKGFRITSALPTNQTEPGNSRS